MIWGLMLPEIGQLLLICALLVSLLQAVLPLLGAHRNNTAWMQTARPAAVLQFVLVAAAFGLLTYAFVTADFSVQYVADNSNSLLPLLYRYSAVWGAHEGSLLLWTLILSLWSLAVARFSRSLPMPVVARVLAVMGMVSVGFLAFLIFTSNPFARVLPAAAEGADLNPLLQDPGLIIHPPMLYFGYVGFVVPFAFTVAALLDGRLNAQWIRWTRPWTLVAWAFLTFGIALGSWWAYYELGWGGWWFWDPVENASFMPWLVGAALIHSQAVTEKRGEFRGWTLLLAIAAFSLSLLGTFLVRSGVVTSVHAFASDPSRGVFILVFLGLVIGGSLVLYALRAPETRATESTGFSWISREGALLVNNVLLTVAAAMVCLGTLYPLLADLLNLGKISVGPPYFAAMFVLLMAPMVLVLPLGPFLKWRRDQPDTLNALLPWWTLAVLAALAVHLTASPSHWKTAAAVLLSLWIATGTLAYWWRRRAQGSLNAETVGMLLAHFGVAVFLAGALVVEARNQQTEVAVALGGSHDLGGYTFRMDSVESVQGPNYVAQRATVTVTQGDKTVVTLHPEKRQYMAGKQIMTEAAIDAGITRDLYVALGESVGNDRWALRVQIKPLVRWIWLGALMMMAGGLVSATDRRFRRVTLRPVEETSP